MTDLDGPLPLEPEARRALAIGVVLALVVQAVPFLRAVFSAFATLVHELGHSVAAWLFGHPAVPAFDFVYGGGWSLRGERSTILVLLVVAAFGALLYAYRANALALKVIGAAAALHALLAFTSWHGTVVTAMGHATELVFAGVFLYRGVSGHAVRVAAERPLHVFVGAFLELQVMRFCWRLIRDVGFLEVYEQGKGGVLNDLHDIALDVQIATGVSPGTTGIAALLLLLCAVPPLAAFAWHRHRPRVHAVLSRLLDPHPA